MKGLIFTYLLTYGGAFLSLFNPFVGLLVYVCFAIVKPESMWYWAVPQGNYSRVVALGLLTGWLAQGFGSWRFGRASNIVFTLLAFWIWSFVSSLLGIDVERSMRCVEVLSKIFLPFIVGMTTIKTWGQLKLLAWVIVASEGYVALEMNLAYYGGFNRLYEVGFGDMDNNCNGIALVACAGMTVFLAMHTPRWSLKALAMTLFALMVNTIFFSYSRGGMLALFVTLGTAFFVMPKRLLSFVAFLLFAAVVWRLAGSAALARFESAFVDAEHRDESAESRLRLWAACWETTLQHPLGLGPDNFPLVADRYGYRVGKEAHTLWLTIAAEFGIPGILLLLRFYGLCLMELWPLRRYSASADPWPACYAQMVITSLVGFAVAAQFVSVRYLEHPYYIALVGACALKLASTPKTRTRATPKAVMAPGSREDGARAPCPRGLHPESVIEWSTAN